MYVKALLKFIIPALSVSFLLAGCYGDDDSHHENYTFSVSGMEDEQVVPGNLNESRKEEIKVSYLSESSQLYRSRKMSVTLQEETGADEMYPVEVPKLSPPFYVENNKCKDGIAKGDTCTFEIVYKPVSIADDFFKEEDVSMKAGDKTFTWKMLGVPENIQETVASSGASAEELPIEVKNTAKNSLNYQVWASDTAAKTFSVTLTNNTEESVSDISITNASPPKSVSYEKAKMDSCEKEKPCELDIAFTPGDEEAIKDGQVGISIGDSSFIHFTYKGFKITYNLGTNSVHRYGKRMFVNPALDLGNYNQLVQNSRILQTWQKDNIVVTGGDAGLFISTNGGVAWRHVPEIPFVQSFLVRDDHIFISTKKLGLLVGEFNMSKGFIGVGHRYDMSDTNLNSNDIRNVTVSPSEKYIFIATGDGLAVGKYDKSNVKIGTEAEDKKVEFKIYNKTSTISLPENVVTSVAFSKGENYVLASTSGGLSVGAYDKETGAIGAITSYKVEEGKLLDNHVNQVVVKDENELLISTIKGLSIATLEENSDDDSKNGVITFLKNYVKTEGGLLGDDVKSVTVSGKNVLVTSDDVSSDTAGGVNVLQYTIKEGKMENPKVIDLLSNHKLNSVTEAEDSHLWLSGNKVLSGATFHSENLGTDKNALENIHPIPGKSLPDPGINSLTLSEDERLVMATDGGVVLGTFTPNTSDTKFYLAGNHDDKVLFHSFGYAVIVKAGLFAGTNAASDNNTYVYDYNKDTGDLGSSSECSTKKVNHITSDGNHIYVSTDGGGIETCTVNDITNITQFTAGIPITSDIDTTIWSSAIVGDRMLISNNKSGVGVSNFNTSNGTVSDIELFNPCGSGDCKISSVLASNDANSDVGKKYALISSGGKGLYVARFKDSTEAPDTANTLSAATSYNSDPDHGGLPDNDVHSTAVIGEKVMIATKGGLAIGKYAKDSGEITEIKSYKLANGLPDNEVRNVVFLEGKYALVATRGGLAITEF